MRREDEESDDDVQKSRHDEAINNIAGDKSRAHALLTRATRTVQSRLPYDRDPVADALLAIGWLLYAQTPDDED